MSTQGYTRDHCKRETPKLTNNKNRKNKNRRISLYSYLEQKDCVRIGSCKCVSYHMLESLSCYGTFSYLSPFPPVSLPSTVYSWS